MAARFQVVFTELLLEKVKSWVEGTRASGHGFEFSRDLKTLHYRVAHEADEWGSGYGRLVHLDLELRHGRAGYLRVKYGLHRPSMTVFVRELYLSGIALGRTESGKSQKRTVRQPLSRTASQLRETGETRVSLAIDLDGQGTSEIDTGVGFFDHMLTLFARHSLIDLRIKAAGDLQVDAHHTVEDVGICLGRALAEALGDKTGIRRYGQRLLPMDEALVSAAVDLSGRAFFAWNMAVPVETLGTFNSQLGEEFWRAVAMEGRFNLHVVGHAGRNTHHILEAAYKAVAQALREAVEFDPRCAGVPSTKGSLHV